MVHDAAADYSDGASMPKFIGNFHNDAKATLGRGVAALADVLAAYVPPGREAARATQAGVREGMEDGGSAASLDQVAKDRNFERGKEVYEAAQCIPATSSGRTAARSARS